MAIVAIRDWYNEQLNNLSSGHKNSSGSLVWDDRSRTATLSLSASGTSRSANYTVGVNGAYIDPKDNKMYIDDKYLWGPFAGVLHQVQTNNDAFWAITGTITGAKAIPAIVAGAGNAITATGTALAPVLPELGNKLNYVFGQATGALHNIQRSTDMLNQLNRIGIFNNAAGRDLITRKITEAYYHAQPILQNNGRHIREIMVMGPNGGVKMQTIWEGAKLITIELFGKATSWFH